MAWDPNRPVPWKRLLVPFAIYGGVAAIALFFFSSGDVPGIVLGLVTGGLLYVGIAVILVKFGWNPPSFGGNRPAPGADAKTSSSGSSRSTPSSANRSRPAPTSRTNAGNPRAKRSR
jgi:hypothetical protein